MPTVTAFALDTLLEPSSASHQHQRLPGSTINNTKPSHSPSHSYVKDQRRRNCTTTSPSACSPNVHHHRHGGRGEQQPVFLSGQHRRSSPAATTSESEARRKGVDDRGRGGRNGRAPAVGPPSRLSATSTGYYISTDLYTMPDSTRIVPTGSVSASSPTSDPSPSPYVVNHKRRGVPRSPPPPRGPSASDNGDGTMDMNPLPRDHRSGITAEEGSRKTGGDDDALDTKRCDDPLDGDKGPDACIHNDEADYFFDPRELMTAVSSSDTEDGSSFPQTGSSGRYHTPPANQSEFYDASEEFVSEGSVSCSSPSFRANIEADLCSIRLDLFEEIDRRKKAEESLTLMQNIFQRIARQLSQVGLSFPPMQPGGEVQYDVDSIAQFCQELVVLRFVFEGVEIVLAHAESQAASEAVIEAKNHEIARLQGRLQYYEAMNREMSQRNQAAIELARRRGLKRKVWQRWVWGCVGLSITVGASLLAFSYFPHGDRNASLVSSECHDSSSGITEYEGSGM